MAIERGWLVVACLGLGSAALVFPLLPTMRPVPVAEGEATADLLPGLVATAAAVDAACARGDATAFAAATTAAHRRTLAERLQALGGDLDAAALRAMATSRQVDRLIGEPLAGRVRGNRSAVAMPRPAGDGAQVLAFEWDGERWRLDDSRHVRVVHDAATARVVVAAAVASRSR